MDMEEWVQQSTYVYIIVVCGMRFGFIRLYQVSFMSETGLNGAPLNQKKLTENVQFAFANARCVWWAGKIRHTTSLGPPPCKRPASLVLVVLPHVFIQYSCHPQYNIHWPTYGTASEPIWKHGKTLSYSLGLRHGAWSELRFPEADLPAQGHLCGRLHPLKSRRTQMLHCLHQRQGFKEKNPKGGS